MSICGKKPVVQSIIGCGTEHITVLVANSCIRKKKKLPAPIPVWAKTGYTRNRTVKVWLSHKVQSSYLFIMLTGI
jgi:hypothetical protein